MNNAKWIKASENNEEACYVFYTDFEIDKKIKSAILKVSAMGLYAAYINKKRIGNELFTPYWTEHKLHTQYQTYDVSDMLRTTGHGREDRPGSRLAPAEHGGCRQGICRC